MGEVMGRLAARGLAGWTLAVALAGLMMLTVGCGSSGGGTSPASTPSPTASSTTGQANSLICQDVDALRTSLTNLTNVKVGSGASGALSANPKDVKAKLTTLSNDAGGEWSAQISGLKTSLTALQTAVTSLSNGTSSLSNVVTTLGGVKNSAQDLLTAAGKHCPSPSPSST
jgi:hypothetical protein